MPSEGKRVEFGMKCCGGRGAQSNGQHAVERLKGHMGCMGTC